MIGTADPASGTACASSAPSRSTTGARTCPPASASLLRTASPRSSITSAARYRRLVAHAGSPRHAPLLRDGVDQGPPRQPSPTCAEAPAAAGRLEPTSERPAHQLLQPLGGASAAAGSLLGRGRDDLGQVLDLLARGEITAQVAARFPLSQAAAALTYAEAGGTSARSSSSRTPNCPTARRSVPRNPVAIELGPNRGLMAPERHIPLWQGLRSACTARLCSARRASVSAALPETPAQEKCRHPPARERRARRTCICGAGLLLSQCAKRRGVTLQAAGALAGLCPSVARRPRLHHGSARADWRIRVI